MLSSKRFLFLLILLLLAIISGVYGYLQKEELESQLKGQLETTERQLVQLDEYRTLTLVDSVLNTGQYFSALSSYSNLRDSLKTPRLASVVQARIVHTRRIISMRTALDTLQNQPARALEELQTLEQPTLQPVQRMRLEEARPNQFDSLTFALQKAEMQIQNLRGRLSRETATDYLTFQSAKGNDVHYVGSVENGKANGRGVGLLSTGSRYVGEWKNNKKHGTGEFYWQDGAHYEGEYFNDSRSGKGTYHFPGGDVFVGVWKNDLRNGQGVFYDKKGKVVAQGVWEDDELVERK